MLRVDTVTNLKMPQKCCCAINPSLFPLKVLPVTKSSHMITFSLQNGVVATLRTSGTEPKIKFYSEYCAAPGIRSADPLSTSPV